MIPSVTLLRLLLESEITMYTKITHDVSFKIQQDCGLTSRQINQIIYNFMIEHKLLVAHDFGGSAVFIIRESKNNDSGGFFCKDYCEDNPDPDQIMTIISELSPGVLYTSDITYQMNNIRFPAQRTHFYNGEKKQAEIISIKYNNQSKALIEQTKI